MNPNLRVLASLRRQRFFGHIQASNYLERRQLVRTHYGI